MTRQRLIKTMSRLRVSGDILGKYENLSCDIVIVRNA